MFLNKVINWFKETTKGGIVTMFLLLLNLVLQATIISKKKLRIVALSNSAIDCVDYMDRSIVPSCKHLQFPCNN